MIMKKELLSMRAVWKGKKYPVRAYYWSDHGDYVVLINDSKENPNLTVPISKLDKLE